jgi:hypothetical protein
MYEKGMAVCKRHLCGRLVLNKSDKPYTTNGIQKLHKQWKTTWTWNMLSVGRGYYEFSSASETDLRSVWAVGMVNLKPGVLRLFEWTNDFNMHTQRNTHAQVWIRLLEPSQEYWMERTLREITSVVGTPLLINNATSKHIFGHYARVLVDMDFSRKLFNEIVVEREGYAFTVEVDYERLLDFCMHCQNIGHDVTTCRWLYPRKDNNTAKEKVVQGKKKISSKRLEWVPLKDNSLGIGSSAAFQDPQQNPTPVSPQLQQQAFDKAVPVQNNHTIVASTSSELEATPQEHDAVIHTNVEGALHNIIPCWQKHLQKLR